MVRLVLVSAICLLAFQELRAAEPATKCEPAACTCCSASSSSLPSAARGQKEIEALLQHPADVNFGQRQTITVGELLNALYKRHGLSIRFDVPALANMYELDAADGLDKLSAEQHSRRSLLASGARSREPIAANSPAILPGTVNRANPIKHLTNYAPQPAPNTTSPSAVARGAAVQCPAAECPAPHGASANGATAPCAASASGTLTAGTAQIGSSTFTISVPAIFALPNGQAAPGSCQRPAASAGIAKQCDTVQEFLRRAKQIEISVATIDFRRTTVATALRLALDAIPDNDTDSPTGLPLAVTNATRLDFLVEDEGILITTRLKALTDKETRVYSVKSISNVDPDELSKVIRQSVRPWSWRSRIDELGDQLKTGIAGVPPTTLAAVAKSGLQLVSDETGIETSQAGDANAVKAAVATAGEYNAGETDDPRLSATTDAGVVSGLVTLAQASLTAIEVVHYADPPTGTIHVLPGKLIITQSQAAHREIAELLKQLSDE